MGERSGARSPPISRFLSSRGTMGASSANDRWRGCDRSQEQKVSELVSDLHHSGRTYQHDPYFLFFFFLKKKKKEKKEKKKKKKRKLHLPPRIELTCFLQTLSIIQNLSFWCIEL
jgi:hypothetical protein